MSLKENQSAKKSNIPVLIRRPNPVGDTSDSMEKLAELEVDLKEQDKWLVKNMQELRLEDLTEEEQPVKNKSLSMLVCVGATAGMLIYSFHGEAIAKAFRFLANKLSP